jgi:Tfp pilus assembly protein PilF
MKNLFYLSIALIFLVSCASQNQDMGSEREIAFATQRLGEEHYNSGQYTAALKSLLEAYKTIPDDPYLNNSLGLVYFAKERYDLAENHFRRALELKPDYIRSKNNLGAAYLKREKWDLAIACFEQISENLLNPTPEVPLSNLGWAYFHKREFKKAIFYFNKSLEIRPEFLVSIHGLASVYIETGYNIQAVDLLEHALEKNPGAAILHSDLAKVHETLKNFDRAKKSWELVIKLEPETSPLARQAQKRLDELN